MRLLILDFINRAKWFYLVVGLLLAVAWLVPSKFPAPLGVGLWLGLMLGASFVPRAVFSLPLSRKEIWRAQWILYIVVPVCLSAASKLLALGIAGTIAPKAWFSPSWIMLSSIYELALFGVLFAGQLPLEYWIHKLGSLLTTLFVGFTIRFVLYTAPFTFVILGGELPTQWRQLTGGTIFVLASGLCITALSFFHSPRITPRTVFWLRPSSRTGKPELKPDLKARYMRTGQTGLKLLVCRQSLVLLAASITAGLESQLPLIIMSRTATEPTLVERGALLFGPHPGLAAAMFFPAVLFTAMWTAFASEWLRVRHLRVLPLSTRTLAAMFTLTPVLFWLTFWVSPLATHWIVLGHLPSILRLEFLAGLTGLTCLLSSAAMQSSAKAPGTFLVLHLLLCAGFIALYVYGQPLSFTVTLLVGVFGLIGVALSFLLNCRALQRNSSVYTSILRLFTPPPRLIAQ